jgi:uncharacterized protein (TIGR02300 family)
LDLAGKLLTAGNTRGKGPAAFRSPHNEVFALAAPELGHKQICPACSAKFYDLGRRPAVCPKCQTSFDPEEALRTRRIRTRAPDYEADEEKEVKVVEEVEGFEEEADETPEIDQAPEAEVLETDEDVEDVAAAPVAPGPEDIGVDFAEEGEIEAEADDEVPFLEDEDEDFPDDDIEGLPGEGGEE